MDLACRVVAFRLAAVAAIHPFKLLIPTKLGFENPKFATLYVSHHRPRRLWSGRGCNWFSGI
jgi:hypothetical protein